MTLREIPASMDLTGGGDRPTFNAALDEKGWRKEPEVSTLWWGDFAAGTDELTVLKALEEAVQYAANKSMMTATVVASIGERRKSFIKRPYRRVMIAVGNRSPVWFAGFRSGVLNAQSRLG